MLRKLSNVIEYVWAIFAVACIVMSIVNYSGGNSEDGLFFGSFALVGVVMYLIRRAFRKRLERSNQK